LRPTPPFYLSIILIVLILVMGRVFCRWVCPLGTLNNMKDALKKTVPVGDRRSLYRWKHDIRLFILAAALFRLNLSGVLDRLSFLIRSFSVGIYPLFNFAVKSIFDTVFQWDLPILVRESAEHLYCMNCDDLCPRNAVSFGFTTRGRLPRSTWAGAMSCLPSLRTSCSCRSSGRRPSRNPVT